MKKTILTSAIIVLVITLAACGGSSSSSNPVSEPAENRNPISNAGTDQNVATGTVVALTGAASTDADGDALTYQWSLTSIPTSSSALLSDSTTAAPTFTVDVDGSYTAELVVNDGTVDSNADSVVVTAATANSAPVADAGVDQSVATGTMVTLDGSASLDADGDSISYQWSLTTVPSSSGALLSNTTSAAPTFTADKDGVYTAELIVNDGTVDSTAVMVTITAATTNSAPTANAGSNQNVETGSSVSLDASASSDPDGDTLTYLWSLTTVPGTSSATLSNSTGQSVTFPADQDGTYIAQLIVNDGTVDSPAVTVTITATTTNAKPVANAGADQSVVFPATVNLDGSASTDADEDGLSYTWFFVSKPTASSAALDNALVVNPSFTADIEGSYVLSLVVNDGAVDSDADNITIIASEPNIAPVADPGPNRAAIVGDTVVLDGSASTDANYDALTYVWELVSVPSTSGAFLSNTTGLSVDFPADVAGVYTARLTVNDGKVDSAPAILTITAN
jgi:predicted aspartyl protease